MQYRYLFRLLVSLVLAGFAYFSLFYFTIYFIAGITMKLGHELLHEETGASINDTTKEMAVGIFSSLWQALTWPYFLYCVGYKKAAKVFIVGGFAFSCFGAFLVYFTLSRNVPESMVEAYSDYAKASSADIVIEHQVKLNLIAAIDDGLTIGDILEVRNSIAKYCTGEPLYNNILEQVKYALPYMVLSLTPVFLDMVLQIDSSFVNSKQACQNGFFDTE